MSLIPLCKSVIYRYGHVCQIKLMLFLPEKGSRRESASNLKLYYTIFLAIRLLLSIEVVSRTIVAVKRTTLDEFLCFLLFSLPEGIVAFSQNRKLKATQAELCTHYQSVPFDICKEHGPYQLENNAQKWSKSSERQN